MAAVAERISVGTSPTLLIAGGRDGREVVVRNRDADPIYVGGDDVETTTGFQLEADESASFSVDTDDDLYAVVASGTAVVHVLRIGA